MTTHIQTNNDHGTAAANIGPDQFTVSQTAESGNFGAAGVGVNGVVVQGGNVDNGFVSAAYDPLNGSGQIQGEVPGRGQITVGGQYQNIETSEDNGSFLTESETTNTALNGSIGTPYIGVGGGTTSSSSTQVTAGGRTEEERQARAEALRNASDDGELLDIIANGESVSSSDMEGWSANGYLSNGMVSVGGGYSTQVSQGITASRDDSGQLSIAYDTNELESINGSLTYAGFGLNGSLTETEGHAVNVDIDETRLTPEAAAELQSSLQSGVLPGAHDIETPEAQEASTSFQAAQARAEEFEAEIERLEGMRNSRGRNRDIGRARRSLNSARDAMQDSRNTLNEQWESRHDAGAEVLPGVTVQLEVESEGSGGALGLQTPIGGTTIHGEMDGTARQTELHDDGSLVETNTRSVQTEGWFVEERADYASVDTEHNVALTTRRDVYNGSEDAALLRDLAGDNAEVQNRLEAPERRQTSRGTRTYGGRTEEQMTAQQTLSTEQIARLGEIQNGEEGAAERFAETGDALATVLRSRPRPRGRGGRNSVLKRTLDGGSTDGVEFEAPTGMDTGDVAAIYDNIEGPEDLAALSASHPDQAAVLQANFAKGAVIAGALDNPGDTIGMLGAISDPGARAQATADVLHLLNERGDENAMRMLGEINRLANTDPILESALEEQTSFQFQERQQTTRTSWRRGRGNGRRNG